MMASLNDYDNDNNDDVRWAHFVMRFIDHMHTRTSIGIVCSICARYAWFCVSCLVAIERLSLLNCETLYYCHVRLLVFPLALVGLSGAVRPSRRVAVLLLRRFNDIAAGTAAAATFAAC